MMPDVANKQEALWRGDFGNVYIDRNVVTDDRLAALTKHWARILRAMDGTPPTSILEAGANIGLNLRAIRRLTEARFFALEPNAKARARLVEDKIVPAENVLDGLCQSIPLRDGTADMAFTSGVLIHIHPDNLLAACRELHRVARRFVVCIEYFADKPEEILYRGQSEALFKRDFGAFYMENFSDLRVVDYGFTWKAMTGLDNLTWWVLEKSG
jgi:pseudaminic acid biosynthesis-associated methylase